MLIDCEVCVVRGPACGDCVVTVLLGTPAGRPVGAMDLDGAERAALAVLAGSGLVPPLRLVPADPGAAGAAPRAPGPGAGRASRPVPGGAERVVGDHDRATIRSRRREAG